MFTVKPLEWNLVRSFFGQKLIAKDCFGNEFARLDLTLMEDPTSRRVEIYQSNTQRRYEAQLMRALEVETDFLRGTKVKKKSGSWWKGKVVGYYSTEQTPKGVAVQLDVPNGPVQIYPVSALELDNSEAAF